MPESGQHLNSRLTCDFDPRRVKLLDGLFARKERLGKGKKGWIKERKKERKKGRRKQALSSSLENNVTFRLGMEEAVGVR